MQAAELRRVEEEKERALGLQRRERELRGRLLSILLNKRTGDPPGSAPTSGPGPVAAATTHADLLQPVLDILQSVSALGGDPTATAPALAPVSAPTQAPAASLNGALAGDPSPEKRGPSVLACIAPNAQPPKGVPLPTGAAAPCKDATRSEHDKCNREPSSGAGGARGTRAGADEPHRERSSRPHRAASREETRSERRARKKRSRQRGSGGGGTAAGGGGGGGSTPRRRSTSPEPPASTTTTTTGSRARRSRSPERPRARRERSREHGRKRSRHRRGDRSRSRSRSGTPSRHRSAWNR